VSERERLGLSADPALVGLNALTAGDPARAERHLVAALAESEAIGAAPRAASTRALLDRARAATAG
jgi:hypothetical protein